MSKRWGRIDKGTDIVVGSVIKKGVFGRKITITEVNKHKGGYFGLQKKDGLATALSNDGKAVFRDVHVAPWTEYRTDNPYMTWCLQDGELRDGNFLIRKNPQ